MSTPERLLVDTTFHAKVEALASATLAVLRAALEEELGTEAAERVLARVVGKVLG